MKIFIATQNKHKIEEIKNIMPEIHFVIPENHIDIQEGDDSYIINALLKANTWQHLYPNYYILADDSGIEVEALNNAPGVISAEWAGKNSSQEELIAKILKELKDIPFEQRNAKFVSYMLLKSPTGEIFVSRGECYGKIALEVSGIKGFGYDPVFLPQEYNFQKSMAELSTEQKNTLSHRKKALIGIRDYLKYLEVK